MSQVERGCVRFTSFALLLLAVGCATSDRKAPASAHVDASVSARDLGAPCKRDSDCVKGSFCDEQQTRDLPVDGLDAGTLEEPLFPGGSCTPKPLAPYNPDGGASCDPLQAQGQQGCGASGTCVTDNVDGKTLVDCRVSCTPSATTSGCKRAGYTCDFGVFACVEGCQVDAECRLSQVDTTGDGNPDMLQYDAKSKAFCDVKTARCAHSENAAAQTGSDCKRLDDCEADGVCVDGLSTFAGLHFPSGYCTKFGCDLAGRSCAGDNTVCEPLRPWTAGLSSAPACLTSCVVGAEPAAQQFGKAGHGKGCREGYRCHFNGGDNELDGVCVGGVYNAVTKNNVGVSCKTDDECYSPFGFGRCLALGVGGATTKTTGGTCAILDCNVPGLPAGICGTGNECIGLTNELTFCVHDCKTASDCATGYACSDDDGDPATSTICYPGCGKDTECRKTESCKIAKGATRGQCAAR